MLAFFLPYLKAQYKNKKSFNLFFQRPRSHVRIVLGRPKFHIGSYKSRLVDCARLWLIMDELGRRRDLPWSSVGDLGQYLRLRGNLTLVI